jgi:predicted MFS family arabinose efflux permease
MDREGNRLTELTPRDRRAASTTLLFARAIYAFNWYNVGAVLPLVGSALGATTPELGIVLGAFLAGAGVFQIPAGLAALRWGNRRVSILALALMGAFCLASAFSPNWIVLALLRFGAGAGAAFFFAPALGLVSSYYPAGSRGPIIGLYNSGFSLGSGVGLFAGALLGAEFGWAWALAVGGVALVGSAIVAPFLLPHTERIRTGRSWRELWTTSQEVLRSRSLWALAISFIGLWSAFFVAAQYFVQYAHEVHPGWSLAVAAGLPTLMIAVEIGGGPFGGWLAERGFDMRWLLVGFGAASAVAIMLVPFSSLSELVVLFAGLGLLDGIIWAVLYLLPTYLPETGGEGLALGLGLLNAINIFGGSGLAVAFAYVATYQNYTVAWLFAGVLALAPLPLLLVVTGHRPSAAAGRPRSLGSPARPGPPE